MLAATLPLFLALADDEADEEEGNDETGRKVAHAGREAAAVAAEDAIAEADDDTASEGNAAVEDALTEADDDAAVEEEEDTSSADEDDDDEEGNVEGPAAEASVARGHELVGASEREE